MNTKHLPFYITGFGILASAFIMSVALAQTPTGSADDGIRYPVAELGNCKDRDTCKTYCDSPSNLKACIVFAEKNNLMSKEEIGSARKFLDAGAKGPGGCTSKDSCETYCNDINRINECVAFAEKTGILPPKELEEAKQVQAAIARGVKPPACKNKKECDVYCEDPNNMKVCVAFGEAAGFLKGKELEDVRKMMAAIDKGAIPPPCKGKDACDAYCSEPANMEACMTFAQAAGFMSQQEADDSKKMLSALKKGVKPPACRGKEECDKYCSDDTHIEECINFSIAAGFMSEKDAEMAKKTKGKGPGGCKGRDECDTFCNNQDNQQTCINFGRDNGLIPPEELQKMQEGQKQFRESFQNMPPEVLACMQNSIGSDALAKFKSGQTMPSRDVGEKIGQCFSQMSGPPGQGQRGGPGAGGQMPPNKQFDGQPGQPNQPGQNQQGQPGENFQPGPGAMNPGGQQMPQQAGPGGCKGPEECRAYCEKNPEVCKNFQPQQNQQGQPGQFIQDQQGQPGQMQPQQQPQGTQPPPSGTQQQFGTPPSGGGGAGFVGPGGCKTAEECQAYCTQNYQDPECQKFGPGSMIEPANQGFFGGVLSILGPLFGIR